MASDRVGAHGDDDAQQRSVTEPGRAGDAAPFGARFYLRARARHSRHRSWWSCSCSPGRASSAAGGPTCCVRCWAPSADALAAQADLHLLADAGRAAAWRMFFVTGEIWRDLGWSGLEYVARASRSRSPSASRSASRPAGIAACPTRSSRSSSAFNATPQVAFLPLIVIWVGTGFATKVLIIFLLAVLPIAINAQAAVRTTDPRLIRVASSFGAGDWRLFRSIILPSAVPFLLAGLRLAIGRGMIGIVVGEIYGSASRRRRHDQSGGLALPDRQGVRRRAHHRRRRRRRWSRSCGGSSAASRSGVRRLIERIRRCSAKLEAQDIRLEYFQPRTNTRLTALDGVNLDDHGRRVRLHRRPVRLRQDHVPLGGRRTDPRDRRAASWSTAQR